MKLVMGDHEEKRGCIFKGTVYCLEYSVEFGADEIALLKKDGTWKQAYIDRSEVYKTYGGPLALSPADLMGTRKEAFTKTGKLAHYEREVKEGCKKIKAHIDALGYYSAGGSGGKKEVSLD